jgi:hypothetical protein
MKSRVMVFIFAIAMIVIIPILAYAASPYLDSYRANAHINISGIKLLMTNTEVEKLVGKGNLIGGFGADFYKYQSETITIAYPSEGLLENKVGYIEISNSDYSIFDVHPGDSTEKARSVLEEYGFKEEVNNKNFFKRGSTWVYVFDKSIRINIEDWTIRGRVY